MPVILEQAEFELVAHRARPGYPGTHEAKARDSTRAVMAEHPHHRWAESHSVFRRGASSILWLRPPAGDRS
jgi:hypothetical protein